jgi:hypothetical protein
VLSEDIKILEGAHLYVAAYARIQDPAAVFSNPNDMVLKIV